MYKYFKPNEYISLAPELMDMLDRAREKAGIPFVINSGFRTKEQNKKVGGKPHSAHLTGEAVDLRCRNSHEMFLILKSLLDVGFTRIFLYDKHIHADISTTLPQEVVKYYNEGNI